MTAADDCDWEVVVTIGQGSEACEIAIGTPPLDRVMSFIEALAEDAPAHEGSVYLRGLQAMRNPSPGRAPIDDRAALAQVRDLLGAGRARSLREACLVVAKTRADGADIDAMAERLRKKMRKLGTKNY